MLSVEHVSKVYETRSGPYRVFDDISFTLERGRHIGILGRNGAGKSTLIRLISGAERPTTGRIRRGMRVSWPLAFVGAFAGNLTGLDNLKFVCRAYGVDYKPLIPWVENFCELGGFFQGTRDALFSRDDDHLIGFRPLLWRSSSTVFSSTRP